MGFLRLAGRKALPVLLLGAFVVLALTALRVRATTTPRRAPSPEVDLRAMGLAVDETRFAAADGVDLEGWLVRGTAGQPAVVLCHAWGSSKESLLPLAIALHERGFPVLLFDFRAHGGSGGRGSTLGLDEKRDVLGALDHARGLDGLDRTKIGVYGIGMGAHAAVLAARERPAVKVLVIEGLYPDPGFEVARRFYRGWGAGLPRVDFLPVGVFAMLTGARPRRAGAEAALVALSGRDLLFLAPEADPALLREIERMYRAVPVEPDVDGNMLILPSSPAGDLFGAELARRDRSVADFFSKRLVRPGNRPRG